MAAIHVDAFKEILDADPIGWLRFTGLPGESIETLPNVIYADLPPLGTSSVMGQMVDANPAGFLNMLGFEVESAEIVEIDLSGDVLYDRLFRISSEEVNYLLNVEIPIAAEPRLVNRLLCCLSTALYEYDLTPLTHVVFLSQDDDCVEIDGAHKSHCIEFNYDVIRLWERSPDDILNGSPTFLPLLPLTRLDLEQTPGYLRQAREIVKDKSEVFQTEMWRRMRLFAELRFGMEHAEELMRANDLA